ncbi:hypothetical protein [Pontibacter chitinilyticus]|uniref:hypothetical protein n=1 Tax=Pontibacter chitinilyticus TaxID=2674989 RepID=UPI00321AD356
MFRNLFRLYLFNKLFGGSDKKEGKSGCGGIGCIGLIVILVLAFFLLRSCAYDFHMPTF